MRQVVWITGITGYSGRWLARYIRDACPEAKILGLARSPRFSGSGIDRYFQLDLSDRDAIIRTAKLMAPTVVFHLAALAPPAPSPEMWRVNVGGTVNLLQGLRRAECLQARIVCAGSAAEYLPSHDGLMSEKSPAGGANEYGRSKWAQTTLALTLASQMGIRANIVRPYNIVGPNIPSRLVAGKICEQLFRTDSDEIHLANTASERDFIDVRDLASAYWQVAIKGRPGHIYDVCSGVSTSIAELVKIFQHIAGVNKKVVSHDGPLAAARPDRVYGQNHKIASLEWKPVFSLEQSVADMLKAARQAGAGRQQPLAG